MLLTLKNTINDSKCCFVLSLGTWHLKLKIGQSHIRTYVLAVSVLLFTCIRYLWTSISIRKWFDSVLWLYNGNGAKWLCDKIAILIGENKIWNKIKVSYAIFLGKK